MIVESPRPVEARTAPSAPSPILRAEGDLLHTADGPLTDLFTAHGTAWLGHGRAEVRVAVAAQLDRVWITGGHPTAAAAAMKVAVDAFLPPGYSLASLASTGMEANELALRIARVRSGRNGAMGFAGAMHGKSLATAHLGWDNGDGLSLPAFERLRFSPRAGAGKTLADAARALARRDAAALFVEPIHASSGGAHADDAFYRALEADARRAGTLLIYDEVLTGFHRTGPRFRFEQHGTRPDIVVFGKACGNGFPVAGVAVRDDVALDPRMLLGSTYSNNPLACAAVAATIGCLQRLDPPQRVARIESTVLRHLGWLRTHPQAALEGAGALWVLSLPAAPAAFAVARELYARGVCVGQQRDQVRLLPALTIDLERLDAACALVAAVVRRQLADGG